MLYVLIVEVSAPCQVRVGALGRLDVLPGWYAYVGSAMRNVDARVRRHLKRGKKKRWHIDYLTARREAHAVGAVIVAPNGLSECGLNLRVGEYLDASCHIANFGASDCSAGCVAHLWHREARVEMAQLAKFLGEDSQLVLGRQRSRQS